MKTKPFLKKRAAKSLAFADLDSAQTTVLGLCWALEYSGASAADIKSAMLTEFAKKPLAMVKKSYSRILDIRSKVPDLPKTIDIVVEALTEYLSDQGVDLTSLQTLTAVAESTTSGKEMSND